MSAITAPGCRVSVESSIDALADEWSELARTTKAPPFLHPGWMAAWWRAFGRGELEILTARRDGRLAGVLPIERRRGNRRSPTNWHTPEFGLVADAADTRAELADALLRRTIGSLSLAFLAADGDDLPCVIDAAKVDGRRQLVRSYERSLYLDVQGEWSDYERALGVHLRKNLRRRWRQLQAQGRLELEITDSDDALEDRLAEAFALEALGTKTAIVAHPATRQFYGEVARWAAACGSLRLAVLRLDRRALAFHLALEQDGVYYPLKGGYDPAFRQFSPGQLIIRATLQRAFVLGLARYEFLGGDEGYKRSWTSTFHDRMLFQAFPASLSGLAEYAAFAYGRPAVKRGLGRG